MYRSCRYFASHLEFLNSCTPYYICRFSYGYIKFFKPTPTLPTPFQCISTPFSLHSAPKPSSNMYSSSKQSLPIYSGHTLTKSSDLPPQLPNVLASPVLFLHTSASSCSSWQWYLAPPPLIRSHQPRAFPSNNWKIQNKPLLFVVTVFPTLILPP